MDDQAARATAADVAARIALPGTGAAALLSDASMVYQWITHRAARLIVSAVTRKQNGTGARPTIMTTGGTVQLQDDDQVDLILDEKDWKGFLTPGTTGNPTARAGDPAVITCTVTSNVITCIAGIPGSTIVDITDGDAHFTEAFDVVPGDVATITVREGVPYKQPVPPPAH